jgi:hypothetical protein
MAEELDWDVEAFDEAFQEVFENGMAKADFKARLVWLPNALKHNKPESPNVVRSWRVELDLLPECDLKNEAISRIREILESIGPSYVQAFDEVLCGDSRKPSSKPSGKASTKPSPNQEQEQEQERALGASPGQASPKTDAPPAATPKPKASPTGTRLPEGWMLPKAWGEWALAERNDMTADDVRREAACFADHWHSKAGADARKADWEATWRNWIRRSNAGGQAKSARPAGKTPPRENFDNVNYGTGGRL